MKRMQKKIAIITCYYQPDYVRAVTLRAALKAQPELEVIEIKNTQRGVMRYPEVLWKVVRARAKLRPDAYLLTFRGQEILPAMLALTAGRPLWFDEFIVPAAYAKFEKHKRSPRTTAKHIISRLGEPLYNFCMRRCAKIVADTQAHAELSAKMAGVNLSRYLALPVSADEAVFMPASSPKEEPFQVFYYSSNMQPLHGVPVVLEAAVQLQNDPVKFVLVGGKAPMRHAAQAAIKKGANVRYVEWMPLSDLATTMHASQLCLGGPFGGTRQARSVVTGKTYQSLACGVATLIGEGEATRDLFVDRQNCLKVPQHDVSALTEAIRWAVAAGDTELQKIGSAGRVLYDKEFSAQALADKIKPLTNSLS